MSYCVVKYHKITERMVGDVILVPEKVLEEAKKISGIGPEDDGLGCYPLEEAQVRQLATLISFNPELEHLG